MIINKEYDETLWLILSGGKKNRNLVAQFVRFIPEQLFTQIQIALKSYQNGKINKKEVYGSIKISRDIIYWYRINMDNGKLELGESLIIDERKIDFETLTLMPFNKDVCNRMKTYDVLILGEYSNTYDIGYDYDHIIDDNALEFNLIKDLFGKMKIETYEILPRCVGKTRAVNMELIPNDYSLKDLSADKVNKLVRRKKKSSR